MTLPTNDMPTNDMPTNDMPTNDICYTISTQHTENFPGKLSLRYAFVTHLYLLDNVFLHLKEVANGG